MSDAPSERPNDMVRSSSISEVQRADPDEALGLHEEWSDDNDDNNDDGAGAGAAAHQHNDDPEEDESSDDDMGPGYFRLHDAIDTGDIEFVKSAISKTINIIGGGTTRHLLLPETSFCQNEIIHSNYLL
jgi:hypothetical protein